MKWIALLLLSIPFSQTLSVKELKDCYSNNNSESITKAFQSAIELCPNCKDLKAKFEQCIKYEDKTAISQNCNVHDSIMDKGDDAEVYIEAFKSCRAFCVQNTLKALTSDEKKIIQPAFLTYKLQVNKCLGITKMTVEDLNQCYDNQASEIVNQAFDIAEISCASCRGLRNSFNTCMTKSNSKDVNCNIHYAIIGKGLQSELYFDSFKTCRRQCLSQTFENLTDVEKSIIQPAFNTLKNEVNKCLEITDVKVDDFKTCIDQKASQKTNAAFDKAYTLCDKPEQCKAVRESFDKCLQNDDPDAKADACKRHDEVIDQGAAAEIDIQAFKDCRANCISKKVESLSEKQKLALQPAFEILEDEVNHCMGIENGLTVKDANRCLAENNYSIKMRSTFNRLYKFCPGCTEHAKAFNLCFAHKDPDSEHPDCKISNALFDKGLVAKLDPQAFKSCIDHCSASKIDKIKDPYSKTAFQNALWVYKRELSICVGIDQITIKELKECYANNAWSQISKAYEQMEKYCPKCKTAKEKASTCLYNDDQATAHKDCRVYASQWKLGDKSLLDSQAMKTCRHHCQQEALKDLDANEKIFYLTAVYTNNVFLHKCIGVSTTVKDYEYCMEFVELENLGDKFVKAYPDVKSKLSKFTDCINYKDSSSQDNNCKQVASQIKQGGVTEIDLEAFKSCRLFCTDNVISSITNSENKKTMNELLSTIKVHFNNCLGIGYTVQDLDQCFAANSNEKVNKQFSKAVEKCSECSNVKSEFEKCLKNDDKDSKHADCNIHDNVIDSGKEAELDIDSFKICRNHCEIAKTKDLKPEQKKAIQPAFTTYKQEVDKCLNVNISVRDLMTCYRNDGIQYVNDEFERAYKKCDNCKDFRAKMNLCLNNLEKTQSHPDCDVLYKSFQVSEDYPLDIEGYKTCRAHCIEVNMKSLSEKDKRAIQPTQDIWKTYTNKCIGIQTTVQDLNQCFQDNASQIVDDAFKLAVKLCPTCANFRTEFNKCLSNEDPDAKHEDCNTHDAIMDQGKLTSIDREAFKKCRAHCINAKLSKYDVKQKRAITPALNALKKQVDQCLGISSTVIDLNTCFKENASQKVEDAFTLANTRYNLSNQIRLEFTQCISNNDPDSKHPDCIEHDSIMDLGGQAEIDQTAYLKCRAYCYQQKVIKKLTDENNKQIVQTAFNTLFSETERCLEIDPTVADLFQCANEETQARISKTVRKADRQCPECNVITRYNSYIRCVQGSETSKDAQHEDCIDHNYVVQMSKKYGTQLELDIPSFKKCRQHCYDVLAKVDTLTKTQIQIIKPAFEIVNKYWNDCLDIAPQVFELNKCIAIAHTDVVEEAFRQAVSSCPDCKDFKTSFEKCLQNEDPDAKHDDCIIHDSIIDQGSNTEININAFKTCRTHCQDVKVNKVAKEHQKWSISPAFNVYNIELNNCLSINTTVQDYNNCLKEVSQRVTWSFDQVERQCKDQDCKQLREQFNQCINNTGISTPECSNHYAILKVGDNAELDIDSFTNCRSSCIDFITKSFDSKKKSIVLPAFNVLKVESNKCIGINLIAKDLDQCMHSNGLDSADLAFDEAVKTCTDCRKLRREYDQCLIDENSSNADCKNHAKLFGLKDTDLNIQSFKKCVDFCQNDKIKDLKGDVKKAASKAFSVLKAETYKCMGVTSNVTEYQQCIVDTGNDLEIKKIFDDLTKNTFCKKCTDVKINFDKCIINVESTDNFCKRHALIIKAGGEAQIEGFSFSRCKKFCLEQEYSKVDAKAQSILKPAFTKYYDSVKECLGITTYEIVTKEELAEEGKKEEENKGSKIVITSSSIVIVQVLMTLIAIVM